MASFLTARGRVSRRLDPRLPDRHFRWRSSFTDILKAHLSVRGEIPVRLLAVHHAHPGRLTLATRRTYYCEPTGDLGQTTTAHAPGDASADDGTLEPLRDAARAETAPRRLAAFRTQIFIVLAVIALLIFGGLTVLVVEGLTAGADLAITRAVQSLAFPGWHRS